MGPPKKPIDWDKVDLYMKAGCTQRKIAESQLITPDTLRDRLQEKYGVDYLTYSTSLCSTGELLIEAVQFQKAIAGNIQMLLWLGKTRCGQREPDMVAARPANDSEIDKDHLIMELQHKLTVLEANGHKPQAE